MIFDLLLLTVAGVAGYLLFAGSRHKGLNDCLLRQLQRHTNQLGRLEQIKDMAEALATSVMADPSASYMSSSHADSLLKTIEMYDRYQGVR